MTPLQKHLAEKKEKKELNIDTFGEIIDDFLDKNDLQLIITSKHGESTMEIKDNLGLGPVITFYVLLRSVAPIAGEVFKSFDERGGEAFDKEKVADAMCELIKQEIMEA